MLPSPLFDLPALSRFVFTALLLLAGALFLLRRAASRYFFVGDEPASFAAEETRLSPMAVAAGRCAACGEPGNKKCSRCKGVRYCSQACQTKHWVADHKHKCKKITSSYDASPRSDANKRKPSGFSAVSLVPSNATCKVLQEPKKILFPYDEFVKLFNWDKPGFPPCGLLNCGNSCFANVVLQCLACTRPLTAYLLEKNHSRGCIRKRDDWCFLCELQVHIQRASESLHPFSPINILSRLPNIGGNLGCGRQEDAHEFMRFAIDTMQSICLDEFGGEKALDMSSQETTLIQHIFGGHLLSQVICTKCNMVSNRYENMMDLTVEIQGDAEHLEECLDQFTAEELLDGENKYKCDGCNDYVKACKRLTVHQAPNILTITLKRFQSGRFGKLNKRVTFPENLDLTPYMSGNRDGTDVYTLYAVVVHVDMLNASFFGHYICYTKGYCGRWYRIDDCKVMNVDVDEVLSQGAYMLLYRRKNVRQEPFARPLEEPLKNNLAEVDTLLSSTSKGTNHVQELTDVGSESKMTSNPIAYDASLGDAGHDRLPAKIDTTEVEDLERVDVDVLIKDNKQLIQEDIPDIRIDDLNSSPSECEVELPSQIDTEKVNEFEGADVNVLIKDNKMLVHEDMPNVHIDDPNLSSSGPENLEDKKDVLHFKLIQSNSVSSVKVSSTAVQTMDFEEPCDIINAACHMESNGSIGILEKSTSDSSFCSKNIVPEMAKTSGVYSTTSIPIQQPSDDSRPKLAQTEVDSLLPNSKGSAAEAKTFISYMENGSSRKPKPMLSSGFLNRAGRKKSIVPDGRIEENSETVVALKVNGSSQGDSVITTARQNIYENSISLSSLSASDNGVVSKSDSVCISGVLLSESHNKPFNKDNILIEDLVRNGHPCKADFSKKPDLASPCQNGCEGQGIDHPLDGILRSQPKDSCEELADIDLEKEENLSGQGFHACDSSMKSYPENGSVTFSRSSMSFQGGILNLPYKKPLNNDENYRKDSNEFDQLCGSDCYGSAEHALHPNGNGNFGWDISHVNGLAPQSCSSEELLVHEESYQQPGCCKNKIEAKETGGAASAYGTGMVFENYNNGA